MKFDVFARNGCHGQNEEIRKSWSWMDCIEAESAEVAARTVFDEVKERYPESWAAWTPSDFKARENDGHPFGERRSK